MAKETKYFLADTGEEVLFGDIIETAFVKEFKNGNKITRNMEFKFSEATLPWALDEGIVIKKKVDKTDDLLDFDEDYDEEWEDLVDRVESLEDRVTELEGIIADMQDE